MINSGSDALYRSGSMPSKKAPRKNFRRGYHGSDKQFSVPVGEEYQFFVRLNQHTKRKLQVSDDEDEEEEGKEEVEGELVVFVVQTDRVVVVRKARSWGWKLGCIRRFGCSNSEFYFESGRLARTGEGMFTFVTDCGERILSRLNMIKEYIRFDLYCQFDLNYHRGVIPEQLLVDTLPNRAVSLKDRSETHHNKKETSGRRTSTGSLPY